MRKLIFGTLILAGCPDPVEVTEFTNEGVICWSQGELIVDFQTCLSSSCDTLTDATCTATLENGVLTIESYGRIESQGNECTDDCGFASATCELPLIEDPSTVTVEHGTSSVAMDDIPDCTF
ncbi:MAG: hypothetical protein H6737_05350 [Alphaproteobacteria bacterium]|nr:hypothetical protein [Alphaproteobacteria bacterium]